MSGRHSPSWLLLPLLAGGMLIPAACVLWFMGEAAHSQADSARRSVIDAYRAQLQFLRNRTREHFAARLAALAATRSKNPAEAFQNVVMQHLADSAILPGYPSLLAPMPRDPLASNAEWLTAQRIEQFATPGEAAAAYERIAARAANASLTARARQAQIRCLLTARQTEPALALIARYFAGPNTGLDLHRRLIAADEQLLALHLLKHSDSRWTRTAQSLLALLTNYRDSAVPSAQRIFLMNELVSLAPEFAPQLPTRAAESLAAQFLAEEPAPAAEPFFQRSRVPGVWKIGLGERRGIGLFRTPTIVAETRKLYNESSAPGVQFALSAPGSPAPAEAIAAGDLLPGWQISFALTDRNLLDQAAQRRLTAYLWAGYLTIAGIAITGMLLGHSLLRQWRVTRMKTDLVAAVSHELKTPLASMRLLVESLQEDGATDQRRVAEYLGLISTENARLTRVIDNLLAFSRIERRRQSFDFAITSAERIATAATEAMREKLHSPECRFTMDVEPGLPPLCADEDAIATVLINLLDNAWKYSPGVKQIALSVTAETERIRLAVSDRGIGISPRDCKRIFRRFFQVDRSLSRQTGGCGLGLSIVDFIVRAHNGSIAVSSQPGEGSTFTVSLPVA